MDPLLHIAGEIQHTKAIQCYGKQNSFGIEVGMSLTVSGRHAVGSTVLLYVVYNSGPILVAVTWAKNEGEGVIIVIVSDNNFREENGPDICDSPYRKWGMHGDGGINAQMDIVTAAFDGCRGPDLAPALPLALFTLLHIGVALHLILESLLGLWSFLCTKLPCVGDWLNVDAGMLERILMAVMKVHHLDVAHGAVLHESLHMR
ncbi:hypothetical protein EV421DRAFT_1744361 [Armillaria borealis]|uniref:Uncharacterized protein n=1 Tax=Armillaria borealis TaxID=47425 RepID=A0AA39MDW2_9AGAR|nr:hypothetical protein EV421DRAFT_1744361 [Armillaria borealis]